MSRGLPRLAFAALLLASFVSQLPYAVAQPLLPFLLARTGASVGSNTGLLTAAYAGALFLFAPLWGSLSDRWPRRTVMLAAIGGLTDSLLALSFTESLAMLYLGLFLGGAFSAGIWPVALAMVSDLNEDPGLKARQFGRIYVAVTAGLLTGPAVGGLMGGRWASGTPVTGGTFVGVGALSVASLIFASFVLPGRKPAQSHAIQPPGSRKATIHLLTVSLLASWGLGAFEVGLTLRARNLGFGPDRIGWMFVECMVAMIAAQALIFSRRRGPDYTRWLLAPASAALAVGLLWLAFSSTEALLIGSVGLVALALGVLSPVIGYWVARMAGEREGAGLGRQTAIASLGQALGAGATGLLFTRVSGSGALAIAAAWSLAAAAVALVLMRNLTRTSALLMPAGADT